MLTQLKNGNWRDLAEVVAIRAEPGYEVRDYVSVGIAKVVKPHVWVSFGRDQCENIDFPTYQEACQHRDELAAMVTAAVAKRLVGGTEVAISYDTTVDLPHVTVGPVPVSPLGGGSATIGTYVSGDGRKYQEVVGVTVASPQEPYAGRAAKLDVFGVPVDHDRLPIDVDWSQQFARVLAVYKERAAKTRETVTNTAPTDPFAKDWSEEPIQEPERVKTWRDEKPML